MHMMQHGDVKFLAYKLELFDPVVCVKTRKQLDKFHTF